MYPDGNVIAVKVKYESARLFVCVLLKVSNAEICVFLLQTFLLYEF